MTCSDKYAKNCPTEGTKITPPEVLGRAVCAHLGCGKPLRGDGMCVDGHRQPSSHPELGTVTRYPAGARPTRRMLRAKPWKRNGAATPAPLAVTRADYVRGAPEQLATGLRSLPPHLRGMVTSYDPQQYRETDAQPFLAPDGLSGFAIKPDGELISVFSLVSGRGDELVAAAVERGATKLDCFEPYLPRLYARHGFREVERYQWDDQYAPANWDYEKNGRPDVVVMERMAA